MKKTFFALALLFTVNLISAQITFSNFQITQLPNPTVQQMKFKVRLSSNFSRKYLRIYLSTDNTLSSDDIYLGSKRVYGHYFNNGSREFMKSTYINLLPQKGEYYVILKIGSNTFSSPVNYCFNIHDDSGDCSINPDLIIDAEYSKQYSSCHSCASYFDEITTSKRPTIYRYGGNITLNPLVVRNIGYGDAHGSLKIRFYLSTDQHIDEGDVSFGNRMILFSPPAPGESTPTMFTDPHSLKVSIEGSDIGNQVPYGNYYLIIIIDEENELGSSEINTANNKYVIPVKYTGTLPGRIKLSLDNNIIEVPLPNTTPILQQDNLSFSKEEIKPNNTYNLKIYKIGTLLTTPLINTNVIENQTIDISNLPNGYYSIHINNTYIKKFQKN